MLVASRPLCRALCPLGAVYALTSRFALLRLRLDEARCTGCGKCATVCPVDLDVRREVGGPECVACGECLRACPVRAIRRQFGA